MSRKGLFGGMLSATLLLSALSAYAVQLPVSEDVNGLIAPQSVQSLAVTGAGGVCRIESSTPTLRGIQCSSTAGVLYALYITSGAASDRGIALDTAPVNSGGVAGGVTTALFDQNSLKISPQVFSVDAITSCTSQHVCGAFVPPIGVRYTNGLWINRHGTANAIAIFRNDSRTLP